MQKARLLLCSMLCIVSVFASTYVPVNAAPKEMANGFEVGDPHLSLDYFDILWLCKGCRCCNTGRYIMNIPELNFGYLYQWVDKNDHSKGFYDRFGESSNGIFELEW